MSALLLLCVLLNIVRPHQEDSVEELVDTIFPHHLFECDAEYEVYETEFSFLKGLGRGFVHAERHRIFFEYYFPASHWVGFSTADQSIDGEEDQCTACYLTNYYALEPRINGSNLFPRCIEECLDDTIFVATVNSDENNLNNWNIIEFQITAQQSEQLEQTMYRIPPPDEILEIWGSAISPYRKDAHFETDVYTIGEKEYIHAQFWRKYDFAPDTDLDQYDASNEWSAFVSGPSSHDMYYADTLCFVSIGSFFGGEYPYDKDALEGLLPGFYIDTQNFANIHCYPLDDIKVDCGQDWSWLTVTKQQFVEESGGDTMDDIVDDITSDLYDDIGDQYDDDNADSLTATAIKSSTTTTTTTTAAAVATDTSTTIAANMVKIKPKTESTTTTKAKAEAEAETTTSSTLQALHGEDCCSAISQISYGDINCLNISQSLSRVDTLEEKWKTQECGRVDKLPTDLSEAIANAAQNDNECDRLWAYFNQIHEICYKYSFTKNRMKIYNHFKAKGGYECFDKNNDECEEKEAEIVDNKSYDFNYDNEEKLSTTNHSKDTKGDKDKDKDKRNAESELAEMEEDGGLTVTSLVVLGLIIAALTLYVLYWFFCSNSSQGYRQSSQFMAGATYYDDDIDTDDYTQKKYGYNKYEDNDNDNNSDWSEDEQLGVIDDDHNNMKIKKHKTKRKHKKKKKSKKNYDGGYDVNINDVDRMPIDSDNVDDVNEAVEINVVNDEDEDEYEDEETLPNGHEEIEDEEIHDQDQ